MKYIIFEEGEEPSESIDCEWETFVKATKSCDHPARWVVVDDMGLHEAHLCSMHILKGFELSTEKVAV